MLSAVKFKMANLTLYNFIVYNLLQANLRSVAVFHCWQQTDLLPLTELFSRNYIFSQYINLKWANESLANFHKDYFDRQLTKLGVFLDMSCDQSHFITNQSSRSLLYTHHYHWLLYDETGNMDRLVQLFQGANLGINADVTYVKRQPEESSETGSLFILYDIYNKGSHVGGKLNITIDQSIYCNQTICEVQQYLSDLHKRTKLHHRNNLSGITIRLAIMITVLPLNISEDKRMAFLNSEESVHLDWLPRLGYRNSLLLQDVLKFNVSYIWRDKWSLNDSKGGAMGVMVNQKADVSTTPFALSSDRIRHVFPMTEISLFRCICIFRTPQNAGMKAAVFLEPFEATVWLVFAALLIICGLLLALTFRLERRWMRNCLQYIPSLLTTCLISFGAACIQGSHLVPNSAGGRLIFISLMLTSFLMYNYYTSIVVSTLLGSPVRSDIQSIQQLADSTLNMGFEPIPYITAYLNSSPRSDIRQLVKRKMDVYSIGEEGVIKVRDQPGYVLISEASNIYSFVEKHYRPHEICELNEIMLRPENAVYTIVHVNSTFRELLKQTQVRLLETGITQKHKLYYSKSYVYCYDSNYVISVGMEYAAPLFIALLFAYFGCLFILILEISWARLSRQHLNKLE